MNITWYWGTDSSCPNLIGSNNSVSNGTYSQTNDNNFSLNDQTYYWKILVNDGHGGWTNATYHFTTVGNNKIVVSKTQNAYSLEINPDGDTLYGYINGNSVSASIDVNWHHVALTYDGSEIKLYKDGVLVDNASLSGDINTNNEDLKLGEYLTGTLDEIRISNTARSTAWLNTSYQNTNNPTTFATFGTQKGILITWTYRKQIWINASMVDNDLANFPVLISMTDSNLKAHALSNGNDIMFVPSTVSWTSGSRTDKLSHEIEKWDNSTGELVAWVNITSVSSTTNTSIYMYYGNSLCTADRQDVTGVWDSNYKMVQHLNETSGMHYDSTNNDNDGTYTGALQDSGGKIDGADGFDGNDDNVNCGNGPILNITSKITVEAWIKTEVASNPAVSKYSSALLVPPDSSQKGYSLFVDNNGKGAFKLGSGTGSNTKGEVSGTSDLTDNQWHYIVGTWDETELEIFVDGKLEGNISWTNTTVSANKNLTIGMESGNAVDDFFNGTIDEARISTINRNESWINASYHNQNRTTGFIEFGQQETQNVAPIQSNPVPSDGATYQLPNPTLSISVNDTNANLMNVTFRTNASGSWQTIGYNASSPNGTYSQTPTDMNQWGTKYWWSANVTDGALWNNHTYNFTTKTFNNVIYYFDAYDTGEAWPNTPANMVDGTNTTFANCGQGTHIQLLNNNTCPGTNLGTIEKVEIRCYGDDSDDVQEATYLRPVFNGTTDGNNYTMDISPEKWSNWTDITNDPNAPSTWTWGNITNLDCDVEANNVGVAGNDYVGIVQIRVNYSASPYLYAQNKGAFKKLTDFIPGATSKDREYTQYIDITKESEVADGILKLKIAEELNETAYLDRVYLRIDGQKIIDIGTIKDSGVFESLIIRSLLKDSDNKYLITSKGDEYLLEFNIPHNFNKIEFVAEGYYIEHHGNNQGCD